MSRLGSPLVNEVVIGITDKDKFNASEPKDDVANFGTYVLYPTLPVAGERAVRRCRRRRRRAMICSRRSSPASPPTVTGSTSSSPRRPT